MPYLSFRRPLFLALLLAASSFFYLLNHVYTSYFHPFTGQAASQPVFDTTQFKPGRLKVPGSNYTRVLVMAKTTKENIDWVHDSLPNLPLAVYDMDHPSNLSMALSDDMLSVPANKGHESMAYLTYIIDHYPNFPDVVLFFHPHKSAWHNNIIHDIDTSTTISRLRDEHIISQGYFNSRCHLDPGCPNWLQVDRPWIFFDWVKKPEEPFLTSKLFHELHGKETKVPKYISQPCCAQFAVSGQRILERPRSFYEHYRSWILSTELDDSTSGRFLEYSWQYIFTGKFEYCPNTSFCYCEGYGVCFEPEDGEEVNGHRVQDSLTAVKHVAETGDAAGAPVPDGMIHGGLGKGKEVEAGKGQGPGKLSEWLAILKKREKVDEKRVSMYEKKQADTDKYRKLTKESEELAHELDRRKSAALERGRRIHGRRSGGG